MKFCVTWGENTTAARPIITFWYDMIRYVCRPNKPNVGLSGPRLYHFPLRWMNVSQFVYGYLEFRVKLNTFVIVENGFTHFWDVQTANRANTETETKQNETWTIAIYIYIFYFISPLVRLSHSGPTPIHAAVWLSRPPVACWIVDTN